MLLGLFEKTVLCKLWRLTTVKERTNMLFPAQFSSNQSGSKNSRSFIPMSSVFPVASMPFSFFFPKDDHHMKLCKVSLTMNMLRSQVSTSRILANSCDPAAKWSIDIYGIPWKNYNGLCGFGTNEVPPLVVSIYWTRKKLHTSIGPSTGANS